MPELPEVEQSARVASRALKGRVIREARLTHCKLFRVPRRSSLDSMATQPTEQIADPNRLQQLLVGARPIVPFTLRHGKLMALLLQSSEGGALCLFARLGMTGKFVSRAPQDPERPSCKMGLTLVDSSGDALYLDFLNTRMFGAIWASYSPPQFVGIEQNKAQQIMFEHEVKASSMGPDALDLSQHPSLWIDQLRRVAGRRQIKSALLDQTVLAGVGNIYAVEGLFAAHIHPLSKLHSLHDDQLLSLAKGINYSMMQTLNSFDESDEIIYGSAQGLASPFRVYGRDGLPCLLCGETLELLRVNGRATVFCPRCQVKL